MGCCSRPFCNSRMGFKLRNEEDILTFLIEATVPAGSIIMVGKTIGHCWKGTPVAKKLQKCVKVKSLPGRIFNMLKKGRKTKGRKRFFNKKHGIKTMDGNRTDVLSEDEILYGARIHTRNGATLPFYRIEVMKHEYHRIATFATFPYLPKAGFFQKAAKAGLFYNGYRDILTCYSCCLTNGNWTPNDDPMEVHQTRSPSCDFICQTNNSGNIPLAAYDGDLALRCTFCGRGLGKVHKGFFCAAVPLHSYFNHLYNFAWHLGWILI